MKFFFHPEAEKEHLNNILYYQSHREGLGEVYLDDFEKLIDYICQFPEAFAIQKKPDIRTFQMGRFPIGIAYRFRLEHVEILAVAHNSRRPFYWSERESTHNST